VKKGVDFFHNLNFCFQKWFRSGFQGAEIVLHPKGHNSKGVRGLKTEHLNSYTFQNNVQALIIVLLTEDIFINRIITIENAEV